MPPSLHFDTDSYWGCVLLSTAELFCVSYLVSWHLAERMETTGGAWCCSTDRPLSAPRWVFSVRIVIQDNPPFSPHPPFPVIWCHHWIFLLLHETWGFDLSALKEERRFHDVCVHFSLADFGATMVHCPATWWHSSFSTTLSSCLYETLLYALSLPSGTSLEGVYLVCMYTSFIIYLLFKRNVVKKNMIKGQSCHLLS